MIVSVADHEPTQAEQDQGEQDQGEQTGGDHRGQQRGASCHQAAA